MLVHTEEVVDAEVAVSSAASAHACKGQVSVHADVSEGSDIAGAEAAVILARLYAAAALSHIGVMEPGACQRSKGEISTGASLGSS